MRILFADYSRCTRDREAGRHRPQIVRLRPLRLRFRAAARIETRLLDSPLMAFITGHPPAAARSDSGGIDEQIIRLAAAPELASSFGGGTTT